jgi:hypothetical protein
MVLLEILVVMPKALKVFLGSRPVFWAGTVTSRGAVTPACGLASSVCLIPVRSIAVNTKPTVPPPPNISNSFSSTTAFPQRDVWICRICWSPRCLLLQ